MIAWPLGLFDCCGVTDGASAAILCRAEDAKKYRKDYVNIKAFGMSASPGWGKERIDYDFTYWDATQHAAKAAYAEAGIKNPRKELDMVELQTASASPSSSPASRCSFARLASSRSR